MGRPTERGQEQKTGWVRMRDPVTGRECECHQELGWVRGKTGIALRPLRDPLTFLERAPEDGEHEAL